MLHWAQERWVSRGLMRNSMEFQGMFQGVSGGFRVVPRVFQWVSDRSMELHDFPVGFRSIPGIFKNIQGRSMEL